MARPVLQQEKDKWYRAPNGRDQQWRATLFIHGVDVSEAVDKRRSATDVAADASQVEAGAFFKIEYERVRLAGEEKVNELEVLDSVVDGECESRATIIVLFVGVDRKGRSPRFGQKSGNAQCVFHSASATD